MNFIEAQNKLNISFDAYLSSAEDKYLWHKRNKSWMYNKSDTSSIPKKKSPTEVSDNTISMPAIQQDQLSVASKLLQNSNNTIGNKRSSQGNLKKNKKQV